MRVVIQPGDTLEVCFADEEGNDLDGDVIVKFTGDEIRVESDWEDSDGRKGLLYSERFGDGRDSDLEALLLPNQ